MKYEGDDRISTDMLPARIHSRPTESGWTIPWQHRAPIAKTNQLCYPTPDNVEIILRSHQVPGLEFSEGQQALGKEMMDTLSPSDQRCHMLLRAAFARLGFETTA